MAYIEVWDETKPAGSRDANLGDDDIREYKRAMRERLAGGGMYFPSTDDANAGLYSYVKFIEQSGNPTPASNRGFLFTKDVSGVTELYWMDSAGTVIQLTTAGKILIGSLAIASEAEGDMLYRNATVWTRLPKGAALDQMRINAGATAPEWFTPAANANVPTGCVSMWGAAIASPPSGWLVCDGSAINRTTYAALFAVVSTIWGVGDGSTTFNLPNFSNRFPYGANEGASAGNASVASAYGPTLTGNDSLVVNPAPGTLNATGGGSDNVPRQYSNMMPPYLAIAFIIKT